MFVWLYEQFKKQKISSSQTPPSLKNLFFNSSLALG
jgi:hypothetical protein